ASSGNFSDAGVWLQGAAPVASDHVIFSVATDPDVPDPYVASMDADTSSDRLSVRQGHVRLDLAGHNYSLTNTSAATPSLSIGEYGGDPDFEVANGTLNSIHAAIGAGDTAEAKLTITSGTWNNSGCVQIGSPTPDLSGI